MGKESILGLVRKVAKKRKKEIVAITTQSTEETAVSALVKKN
jgi:hypothetical protein